MHVVIFEGNRWPTFAPLSLSRPVFTLVSGMSTLLEKQVRHLRPSRLTLWVRPQLEEHCRTRLVPALKVPTEINRPLDDEPALLLSGRSIPFGRFEWPPHEAVVADDRGTNVSSAYTTRPGLSPQDLWNRTDRWTSLLSLPHNMPQTRLVESLWDLIHWNEESLIQDSLELRGKSGAHPAGPYHMLNELDVWLGDGVSLEPGCVLDARKGPVVLGERVTVGANAVVQGPCHVAGYTQIMPLSIVRPGTSIGTMCKIGGEVSNSIIHGYTNKSHEGYLGDSYLGRWVNFGAGTTTSNMKNTYGEITVKVGGRETPTGRRFLGALVGDHCKTGTLTRLVPGAYVGFCTMLSGSTAAPSCVPSYTFWSDGGAEPYRMEKAMEVTQRVFARRDRKFTETDERVMRYVAEVAPKVECAKAEAPPVLAGDAE
jgi:UDP-N-acetylglucosamine diphosphorylase / glucose-1-phosphate thymidylyltransferase / UDP-N-acetylgalactosamine diphosphorylase / glucosamine-1-phosphate N-acetyltransferase / galactosamine-1-phosphate N-acetyltransferase